MWRERSSYARPVLATSASHMTSSDDVEIRSPPLNQWRSRLFSNDDGKEPQNSNCIIKWVAKRFLLQRCFIVPDAAPLFVVRDWIILLPFLFCWRCNARCICNNHGGCSKLANHNGKLPRLNISFRWMMLFILHLCLLILIAFFMFSKFWKNFESGRLNFVYNCPVYIGEYFLWAARFLWLTDCASQITRAASNKLWQTFSFLSNEHRRCNSFYLFVGSLKMINHYVVAPLWLLVDR